jgi:hypothetical protein
MTAQAFMLYAKNKDDIRMNDLVSANLRMCLLTSSYTPNITATGHSLYSELTNELSTANGYTAGGYGLTGTVAATAGNDGAKLSSGNATWTAAGGSIPAFRYAVLYYLGTLWSMTNPLIGYILCDNTPADIPATTTGNTLTITCPATGWFDLV